MECGEKKLPTKSSSSSHVHLMFLWACSCALWDQNILSGISFNMIFLMWIENNRENKETFACVVIMQNDFNLVIN